MARLTDTDRQQFLALTKTGWQQTKPECSPELLALTLSARSSYCRWATQAAKFYKGSKPVRFEGNHWKL